MLLSWAIVADLNIANSFLQKSCGGGGQAVDRLVRTTLNELVCGAGGRLGRMGRWSPGACLKRDRVPTCPVADAAVGSRRDDEAVDVLQRHTRKHYRHNQESPLVARPDGRRGRWRGASAQCRRRRPLERGLPSSSAGAVAVNPQEATTVQVAF